ncbi:group II truncated hemoglobin [Aquabacter cavernae]|uniref:group II truncated hemoglobin n=1 Tax=Aquabacter cavernae TaxID=2496029 RepID=UPI000F8E326F|nr:group II truncated hemoglobin [Aquabacter cavernae]
MTSPETETSAASLYDRIGGERTIKRLTRRFYDLMDTLPEAAACRAIHPESLAGSEEKLFDYLSFWLGGPPLFVQKHGAPMLRRRHFPAAIGPAERDGWLICFRQAFAETVTDPELTGLILPQVEALAMHMQNRP